MDPLWNNATQYPAFPHITSKNCHWRRVSFSSFALEVHALSTELFKLLGKCPLGHVKIISTLFKTKFQTEITSSFLVSYKTTSTSVHYKCKTEITSSTLISDSEKLEITNTILIQQQIQTKSLQSADFFNQQTALPNTSNKSRLNCHSPNWHLEKQQSNIPEFEFACITLDLSQKQTLEIHLTIRTMI